MLLKKKCKTVPRTVPNHGKIACLRIYDSSCNKSMIQHRVLCVSRPDIPFLSWQLKRAHRCKKKALMASQECNDIEMTQDGNGGRCDCNACNDHKTFRPHLAACTGPYSCAPVSQEWDYMVSKVPNRTKEGEPRIVTEVMLTIAVVWMWSEVDRKTFAFHRPRPEQVSLSIKCYQVTVF